jgi:hypothetical protein
MKTMTTRAVALAGALALSLGAAACSKADTPTAASTGSSAASSASTSATSTAAQAPQPADLLEKAKTNALAATSAVFAGDVEQDGKKVTIEFKGTSDGKTSDISIAMEGSGRARLITVPDAVYIQADETFWKKQGAPASVQKAGDKFIKAPSSASAMADSLSLKSFLEKAFAEVSADKLSSTVGEESVNGTECWVLTDKKGKSEGALYVSKDAFQVVRFSGSSKSPGQLDFSRWNEDLGIKAPDASQIMPLG